jgi:hypothetical protein
MTVRISANEKGSPAGKPSMTNQLFPIQPRACQGVVTMVMPSANPA